MQKDDRVKMTKKALRQGLDFGNARYKRSSTGVVVSVPAPNLVRILRDHRKTVELYHISFWEKDD